MQEHLYKKCGIREYQVRLERHYYENSWISVNVCIIPASVDRLQIVYIFRLFIYCTNDFSKNFVKFVHFLLTSEWKQYKITPYIKTEKISHSIRTK